ncbi:unnamed protein product [Linum trigynum]|uniref:Uncharacterized protein n=1 Tax=Linum trigynum TaxID=586398 RepID=A0AAV2E483_9ROSI
MVNTRWTRDRFCSILLRRRNWGWEINAAAAGGDEEELGGGDGCRGGGWLRRKELVVGGRTLAPPATKKNWGEEMDAEAAGGCEEEELVVGGRTKCYVNASRSIGWTSLIEQAAVGIIEASRWPVKFVSTIAI